MFIEKNHEKTIKCSLKQRCSCFGQNRSMFFCIDNKLRVMSVVWHACMPREFTVVYCHERKFALSPISTYWNGVRKVNGTITFSTRWQFLVQCRPNSYELNTFTTITCITVSVSFVITNWKHFLKLVSVKWSDGMTANRKSHYFSRGFHRTYPIHKMVTINLLEFICALRRQKSMLW